MSRDLAAIEEGANLAPRVCPGDGLYFAGIEFLDAARASGGRARAFFRSSETSGFMRLFYTL